MVVQSTTIIGSLIFSTRKDTGTNHGDIRVKAVYT